MTVAAPVLGSPVPRGTVGVNGFYLTHFLGAVFPICSGLLLYGWRGAGLLAAVMGSTALATAVWRRIGPRGHTLHWAHTLWFGLLLALMLPAELFSAATSPQLWPLLPASSLILVILMWQFGGLGGGRVHPILATYLLIVLCFGELMVPHRILNRDHLLLGNLFRSAPLDLRSELNEPWIHRLHSATDASIIEPATERLIHYTTGHQVPERRLLTLASLLRDSMPPLEDFIIAGQPSALGVGSILAVIIGGLFLLYRGMFDYRIPLLICVAAYAALLILPVPALISTGPQWRWGLSRQGMGGWSVAITFVNYEMTASPLVFTAFFLATTGAIRPMTRRGRTIYALSVGVASAALQLYVSVSYGPYLALLIISLLTPQLDRWFRSKPLV